MEDLNQIVDSLWLTSKIHWDLTLYWIFFINMILLVIQAEGSAFATLLSIIVLVSAAIDKTYAFGYMLNVDLTRYTEVQCHEEVFIGTYLIRVAMFVAPLTLAGSTRDPKVRGLAIIAGISGAVYMFARWYFDQRDSMVTDLVCAYTGLVVVAARIIWGKKLLLGTIHRHIPVTIAGRVAAHDVEVHVT